MGRRPIGERAMTATERKRRQLAKLATPVAMTSSTLPVVDESPLIRLEHLRLWPERLAPWLRLRLGHQVTVRLRDELSIAIDAAPTGGIGHE